ncbi:MAG: glycosyl transferase [Proteobacteria bacterium]|nr:glycosyl transferase [Pseudomonadota bacterium]
MTVPSISVILPVYNGAEDVAKSIQTVLTQTFSDFELIVIDDGSKDNSSEVLGEINDPRLRLYRQENIGLAATLNRGIGLARGRYIARQDQDDLSMPTRFAEQFEYMEAHPDCALLGTRAEIWVGDKRSDRNHDHPTVNAALRFELLFNNPFVHSSVMLRKDALDAVGGYSTDKTRQPPEDYELWSRLARGYEVANLSERLLAYREVPASMSRTGPNPFVEKLVLLCAENLAHCVGDGVPTRDMKDIAALTHGALHLLSPSPNLKRMAAIISQAGLRCSRQDDPACDVVDRAKQRNNSLSHQYFMYRHNAGFIRSVVRFLRQVKRKIYH